MKKLGAQLHSGNCAADAQECVDAMVVCEWGTGKTREGQKEGKDRLGTRAR